MFDHYPEMIEFKVGKKASYTAEMKEFRERCGHFFEEMTEYMREKENKDEAAAEIADTFAYAVKERFVKKRGPGRGKIPGKTKLDLSFFMVYYVLPALLLTGKSDAECIADQLRDTWNKEMDQRITYVDYETIRGAFQEKLFGLIPIPDKRKE